MQLKFGYKDEGIKRKKFVSRGSDGNTVYYMQHNGTITVTYNEQNYNMSDYINFIKK